MGVHVGKQAFVLRSPPKRFTRPFAGRWIVQTYEGAEHSKMFGRLLSGNAGGGNLELGGDRW